MAVIGDKLFAIGGTNFRFHFVRSVECLDLSVPNSAWTAVASMTLPRSCFRVAVTGGEIYLYDYAIEGNDDASISMECFDPNEGPQGQWSLWSEATEFPLSAGFAAF